MKKASGGSSGDGDKVARTRKPRPKFFNLAAEQERAAAAAAMQAALEEKQRIRGAAGRHLRQDADEDGPRLPSLTRSSPYPGGRPLAGVLNRVGRGRDSDAGAAPDIADFPHESKRTDIVARGDARARAPEDKDEIYRDRSDKSENAVDFLKRNYAAQLEEGSLTLSDLRGKDESLWRALRNWAHHGQHDIETLLPRGRTTAGAPRKDGGVNKQDLNPSDPRDALALAMLERRERERERISRRRLGSTLG